MLKNIKKLLLMILSFSFLFFTVQPMKFVGGEFRLSDNSAFISKVSNSYELAKVSFFDNKTQDSDLVDYSINDPLRQYDMDFTEEEKFEKKSLKRKV